MVGKLCSEPANRDKRSDVLAMETPTGPQLALGALTEALAEALAARLVPQLAAAITECLGDPQERNLKERLLTIQEAADALSVSPRTVRRLLEAGKLRSVVVGGASRRIPSGAIADYLTAVAPSSPRALPRPAA